VILGGTVTNSGTLFANGSNSLVEIVSGAIITGGGIAEVGNGIVAFAGSSSENVTFLSSGNGGLEIADSPNFSTSAYAGTVSGFGGVNHANHKQHIDLFAVMSDSTVSATYTSTGSNGGVLTVTSGALHTTVATIDFAGKYVTSNFHITAGSGGTVEIVDPAVVNGGSVDTRAVNAQALRNGVDLPNIAFGPQTTLAYTANAADAGGTLTVSDGRHAASVALLGNYMAGSFAAMGDGHGGTLVVEAQQADQQLLLAHALHR
jgi:hypothetical protein